MVGKMFLIFYMSLTIQFTNSIISTNADSNCASYGDLCYQRVPKSCCGNLECRQSFDNRYRCECKADYDWNDGQCQLVPDKYCSNNIDCKDIKYSECSEKNVCACKSHYIKFNPYTCKGFIGASCDRNYECFPENSICLDGLCQCKCDYVSQSNDLCLPTFFELTCTAGDDRCQDTEFSGCVHGKCYCHPNHVVVNNSMCAPLLNENCGKNRVCAVDNSNCDNMKCQCKSFYRALSNNRCLPTRLYNYCKVNDDCGFIDNSECTKFNYCRCKNNYFMFNETTCAISLNGKCESNADCLIENSICLKKTCQCKISFRNYFNEKCQPVLHKSCETNFDCDDGKFAECSENNRCVCKLNYIAVEEDSACLPLITGHCATDDDCKPENSYCHYNRCQCKRYFSPEVINGTNKCVQVLLGTRCVTSSDCRLFKNSKCSLDSICVCLDNSYALNNKTLCLPSIGGNCLTDKDCRIKNSYCLNGQCQCDPNYVAVSDNQCVTKTAAVSCTVDIECGEPWHAKCSSNHNCYCKTNNRLVNKSTCSPLIGGACWRDDQCVVANSTCIDFHCRCNENGFKAVANNLCIDL